MRTVFVLMPFRYHDINTHYREVVKPAIVDCGWRCVRVDENDDATFIITREVIRQIEIADIVLADLTKLNPNVFYELGVAHAFGTNVLMIAKQGQKIPFDLKNHRVFQYTNDDKGRDDLRRYLEASIRDLSWSKKENNPVHQYSSRVRELLDFYTPTDCITDNSPVAKEVYRLMSKSTPIPYPSARTKHVVFITGGVAVGKTTFSHLLRDTIEAEEGSGMVQVVSLDAYQLDRAEAMKRNISNGYARENWRIAEAASDIRRIIIDGEAISCAPYDHRTGRHTTDKVLCHPRKYLIVEGLPAFDDDLIELSNFKIFIGGKMPRREQNLRIKVAYHERGYPLRKAITQSEEEFRGFISQLHPKRKLATIIINISSDQWSYGLGERDDTF